MNRKYPNVTGNWTYGHIVVPEKLIYIGSSGEPKCCRRWRPSGYEGTELQPYIEKHGWDNIKHIVFKDGLTPKQAKQLEDLLITQAKIDGWCINGQGSGGYTIDNRKEYSKQYYNEHKDEIKNRNKIYYQEHIEERKEYDKKRLSTPEGKIYGRVKAFNDYHPDRKIETPLEAKKKYLETGYIPNYIKNDDLI